MKSILLLELSLFRNDIISFRPKKDLSFIGEKLKVVKLIRNVKKLFYPLIKNDNRFFKTYFDGSSKKINLFLKNKINEKKNKKNCSYHSSKNGFKKISWKSYEKNL